MRIWLVVALAVAAVVAEPEAEANADPHYYGYYGYGGLGYHRTRWVDGYGYALSYGHYLGKREAEADPEASPEAEADPALLYSTSYGLGHLGHLGLPGYYGHTHGLPATVDKPVTELAPAVVADSKIVRVLNAPYGIPYRYGPTPLPVLNRGVAGVNPVVAPVYPNGLPVTVAKPVAEVAPAALEEPKVVRVLNAPYGAPYRYGPTISGVGPKADAFGRRYWW